MQQPSPGFTVISYRVGPPTPTLPVRTKKRGKYSDEQVDWIRYHREDCELDWDTITPLFQAKFPGAKDGSQGLSTRYYRDNVLPQVDAQDQVVQDKNGKVLYTQSKVRKKQLTDGVPYLLTERKPKSALKYTWVSAKHKEIARMALDENQNTSKSSPLNLRCRCVCLLTTSSERTLAKTYRGSGRYREAYTSTEKTKDGKSRTTESPYE